MKLPLTLSIVIALMAGDGMLSTCARADEFASIASVLGSNDGTPIPTGLPAAIASGSDDPFPLPETPRRFTLLGGNDTGPDPFVAGDDPMPIPTWNCGFCVPSDDPNPLPERSPCCYAVCGDTAGTCAASGDRGTSPFNSALLLTEIALIAANLTSITPLLLH